jgi:hypothetical protein
MNKEQLNGALGHPDPHWQLRFMRKCDLDAMDRLLVEAKHPLSFEPGTQESRFLRLQREGFRFT